MRQAASSAGLTKTVIFVFLNVIKALGLALIVRSSQNDTVPVSTVINRIPNGSMEQMHSESKKALKNV